MATPFLTDHELSSTTFVTAIVAKRSVFQEAPKLEVCRDDSGKTLRRLLGCELVSQPLVRSMGCPGLK